ncbi:hypothetical protein QQS21_012021 [Conoideocrella luteorostrata]|uniref:Uncharacterized protein n=1 Tax=Conoideocrella luteorostrata TaxID=1105319 RepID=A0AAJ0FV97_9HYPO|nr:hypothetical protein QQS21_012021 [Conoideocrella luteorostrata]
MVQLVVLAIFAIASEAGFALAWECSTKLHYCGKKLIESGNYTDVLSNALTVAGLIPDDSARNASLFYCKDDSEVIWQQYCDKCVEVWGHSDYCTVMNQSIDAVLSNTLVSEGPDPIDQCNVNQDTVDQDTVDQDNVEQDTVDQDNVEQDTVKQDTVKQDTVKQGTVKQE